MILWLVACGTETAPMVTEPPPVPAPVPVAPVEVPPDIVFVSIDTLRPDALGAYGYERPTSPFIDGLAAKGVRFAHARSASPWTLPAHVTMLTGRLPTTHGVVEDDLRLSDGVPVLPELLAARGVATGGAVATYFVSSVYRFDRGFEHFQDFGLRDKGENRKAAIDTARVVDDLIAYVRTVPRDKPLFLFLHTYDVHYAYDPPPPYDTRFDRAPAEGDATYRSYGYYLKNPVDPAQLEHQRAQYDEAIAYVDDQLARLAGVLAEAGRTPRWVITADHGEEFGERGSWGHGHTLYAEQLRIPLIVSGPGLPEGVVVEEPVGNHDLAPTLAAWTGVGLKSPDGIDLTPFLDGVTPPPDRPFIAEVSRHRTQRLSLLEGDRRLEWDLLTKQLEVFARDDERAPLVEPPDPLRDRLIGLMPKPWVATRPVRVRVTAEGTIVGGRLRANLTAGQRFGVFPLDTPVQVVNGPGPYTAAVGGAEDGTLRWEGSDRPLPITLDAETRAALEALGYVQGD